MAVDEALAVAPAADAPDRLLEQPIQFKDSMESSQSDLNPVPESSTPAPALGWKDLGLSPEILEVIAKAGYTSPTPVQVQTIPIAIQGIDVIASAQTGTGKTASFVLPMVQQFRGRQGTFGLILAPTREIAQQIHQTIEILGVPLGIRSIVLIGGIDMRHDTTALATYPQIIVATPGRLCDHLDRGNIWLDYLEVIVLDEADRMLDMGFSTQLNRIMDDVPNDRQTLLFSATISASVQRLADKILHKPERVSIGRPMSTIGGVVQHLLWMKEESKNRELQKLIRQEKGSIIVFTRSKDGATRVWRSLHSAGVYEATYIHSDRLQSHREQALQEFKDGKYRILIATDVAGRGIHIDDVAHVINYDLPMEAENYVHRIGRTGRAGQTGISTTFATHRDRAAIREIEKLIGKPIPAQYTSSYPQPTEGGVDEAPAPSSRGGRGGSKSGGRNAGGSSPKAPTPTPGAPSGRGPRPLSTPISAADSMAAAHESGRAPVRAQAPAASDLYQPMEGGDAPSAVTTSPGTPAPRPILPRAPHNGANESGSGNPPVASTGAGPREPSSENDRPKRRRTRGGRGRSESGSEKSGPVSANGAPEFSNRNEGGSRRGGGSGNGSNGGGSPFPV